MAVVRFVSQKCSTMKSYLGENITIIAAGTFSYCIPQMAEEIQKIYAAGADVIVWLTNRLACSHESDAIWLRNAETLLRALPEDIPLGFYECPEPYKRLLTLEDIRWGLQQERFYFIKDTCCDPGILSQRLELISGTKLKLFNANAQTLLYSLRKGAYGYSSVMANIHPELYAWLCENYKQYPMLAEEVQHVLCFTAFVETLSYPLIAKYVMQKGGVPLEISSRVREKEAFTSYHAFVMDDLMEMTKREMERLPNAIKC